DVPLRRKFPISQPSILERFAKNNRRYSYDFRLKPHGFVQAVTPALQTGKSDLQPIAPFERDEARARRLPWIDFDTGKSVLLDWDGQHLAGTVPVVSLSEYVEKYARHPESKAADKDGNPANEETRGVLERLHIQSVHLSRIGKEVDRLDEEDGATL